MERWLFVLMFAAAMGCGLVAGVFFAFSSFVMRALADIPAPQGVRAMQRINVVVINRSFMGLFFGTAALCAVLGVWAFADLARPAAGWSVAGSAAYLIGTIGVTMVCNVPLNNILARVEPESTDGEHAWASYVKSWTAWNTVRTTASALAAGCFMMALVAPHG